MSKGYILNDNNNTINGVNDFTSFPTLPNIFPTLPTQAVNKEYVDTFIQGLLPKQACDLATDPLTNTDITLSGEQTIDGTMTSSSRVLVKDQVSNPQDNGIYDTGAGAWTRSADYNTSAEVVAGTFTFILGGTVNINTTWTQVTVAPTLNTDPLIFTRLAGITDPAGNNTYVQYNDNGVFGGSQFFTWDNSVENFTVGSSIYTGGLIFTNGSVGVVAIGDVGGVGNSTGITVLDNTISIQYSANDQLFQTLGVYIGGLMSLSETGGLVFLGDIASSNNGTTLSISDSTQVIAMHTGGTDISIDGVLNQIIITTTTLQSTATLHQFIGNVGIFTGTPISELDVTNASASAGTVGFNIRNTTTNGRSQIQLQSNSAAAHYQLNYYNSLHAPVGLLLAGTASIETNAPNGLIIGMTTSAKPIIFALGGTATGNEVARITSAGVGIGTLGNPVASAILETASTTQGFLPPRMTTTQRNAISSPAEGLIVYDLTIHGVFVYDGTSWVQL